MRVPVYVQNRHIHLSQIDANKLFWKWYEFCIEKKFTQPWEFFAKEKIKIKWPSWEIDNVDIILPMRKETQVEIFLSDNEILWIHAKPTTSWNLWQAEAITLIWPNWDSYLPHAVIIAEKHIHMSVAQAIDFWFKNNQIVSVKTHWDSPTIFWNVKIKANDKYDFDFHINSEEWKCAWLHTDDRAEIIK